MANYGSMGNRRYTVYRGNNLTVEFEMDRKGIAKCAVGKELRAATTSTVVDRALPYAKSISPYNPNSKGPHYRDSFRVTQGFRTIAHMRRVETRLHNVSKHSTEVEWKNESRVLTRTLGYLNHDSILAELARDAARVARQQKFNPALHPRGARGRFVPRRTTS